MIPRHSILLAAGAALLLLSDPAPAQVNNQWVSFTKTPAKLAVTPLSITDPNTQVVFRTGDFDKDGWDDVVAVRKSQASQIAPRPNFLLMNVNGVLTDKTAQFATTTDVVGDLGFNTPTNDREVAIADVNDDTWLDLVTCVSLSDGKSKNLSHPRVYINLGENGNGDWLGFRYEEARIPQLMTVGGMAVAPRFCGMGLADVTGDGSPDLYFVDYDTTETNIAEPANWDLNDRLLVNDGNGFFTDQSAARFTVAQLNSSFGADVVIHDLNADGFNDIIKDSTLTDPLKVRAIYNNPSDVGNYKLMGLQDFGTGAPYGVEIGNLNNDDILDAVIVDDNNDKFRLGTGYNGLNQVIWGALKNYTFVTGSDDGFGHNPYIKDLNNDGWNDVLITDVDGDLLGCGRRGHIYHNTGTVPGDLNLVLKEESELASGSTGAGWKGVVGMTAVDLKGSYDFGFGDFDKDGDLDILLANCVNGAVYYQNNTVSIPQICQTDLGFAGPGNMAFSICGDDLTFAGSSATFSVTGAAPSVLLNVVIGLASNPTPFKGGILAPVPFSAILAFPATPAGTFELPITGGANSSIHVIMQVVANNGGTFEFSNALDAEIGF